MKKYLLTFFLFQKRLLKRPSFLIIFGLMIFITIGLRITAKMKSGVFTIALVKNNTNEDSVNEIISSLMNSSSLLNFIECENEETAKNLITQNKISAAWIFKDNFDETMKKAGESERVISVVKIYETQDTPLLSFTREILYSKLYPYFSYEVSKAYTKNKAGIIFSESEYREIYDYYTISDSLFSLQSISGKKEDSQNYLTSPLRGILALWFILCGFAATLYFMKDDQNGLFVWFPKNKNFLLSCGMHLIVLADSFVFMLIAILSSGIFTSFFSEIIPLILLLLSTTFFCNILRIICRKPYILGAVFPFILILMIVFCPVFINIRNFRFIQFLLPPFYYLNSVYNPLYLLFMIIFTLILGIINFILCSPKLLTKNS